MKVAFVCAHNACRSQIAEALSKLFESDEYEAYSAGTDPAEEIDGGAVEVVQELYEVDMTETQRPKAIAELPPVDVVITMGCGVKCPYIPCKYREDWELDDPTGKEKIDYVRTALAIERKISELTRKVGRLAA